MNNQRTKSFLLLLLIIVGALPSQLVLTTLSDSDSSLISDVTPLRGDTKYAQIPRLISDNSDETGISCEDNEDSMFPSQSQPNYAIGSQEGAGGGSVNVNDSLNIIDTESFSLADSVVIPDDHRDSTTITIPTSYENKTGLFNISNVTPLNDWRNVENESTGLFDLESERSGWDFQEVAMEISFPEDYVNLTSALVVITSIPDFTIQPNATLVIVNATKPGSEWVPNESDVLGWKSFTGPASGPTTITFDTPITLRGDRHYFMILNDTSSDLLAAGWKWGARIDPGTAGSGNEGYEDSVDEGNLYWKITHSSGTWYSDDFGEKYDLSLRIRVKPVQKSGTTFINKIYDNPEELSLIYNNSLDQTQLSQFEWFIWNGTSENIHRFIANTSVSFTLSWIVNLTYSGNPISVSSSYSINNDSKSLWNIDFSSSIVSTGYNIRNRTFLISGLMNDWDGYACYHGTTLVYNQTNEGLFNTSVAYTNKSSTMSINSSTLSSTTSWSLKFDAPNYLLDFNLSRGGSFLAFPYQANVTDTVDINIEVPDSGGNMSYWIDDFDGQAIHNIIDYTSTDYTDQWIINDNVSQTTNVNGTYDLQAFWHNSDKTKVGTLTRMLDVFINTSISVQTESQVVIGQQVNVTTLYKSIHNDSHVQNADIQCYVNWTTDKSMDQMAGTEYNASFPTQGLVDAGEKGNITVVTQVGWFTNWTETIIISFVESSLLEVNTSPVLTLEWRENTTLEINYSIASNGSGIDFGVSFTIDESPINPQYDGVEEVYRFQFNSTDYGGAGTHSNINISASHSDYLDQTWKFDLVVTLGITLINGSVNGQAHSNKTIFEQRYADSDKDNFTLNLAYYHTLTSNILDSSAPNIVSTVPYTLSSQEPNLTWTITFGPNQVGVFAIEIAFIVTNYAQAKYIFNLTVLEAHTELDTDYVDNSEVYYGESYTFMLFYNNTDWNENITTLDLAQITISDENKIQYEGKIGDLYNFTFNYDSQFISVTSHSITITFDWGNYEASMILLNFSVVKSPFVAVIGKETVSGDDLEDGISNYTRNYSPNEFDNLSLSFSYYASKTSQILDLSSGEVTFNVDGSVLYYRIEELNHNWTLLFNGSAIGSYLLEITFSHENYTSLIFEVYYTIQPALSSITAYSTSISNSPINGTVQTGNPLNFWVVWQSEYGEFLNDSDGVFSNSTSVVFLSSISINGTHYFSFSEMTTGIYTFNLTFGTALYLSLNLTLHIQTTDRALAIDDSLSSHPDGWDWDLPYFLQYGDTYFFYVYVKDSINETPTNIAPGDMNIPTNMSFENVSDGYHLFSYQAWKVGTISNLMIRFDKANYVFTTYTITFIVTVADSEVIATSSSVETIWTQDVNISTIWQTVPNIQSNTTSRVLHINSSAISTSENWVIFRECNNGNYTFTINADSVGTFTVTLTFQSNISTTQYHELQVTILPVPTKFGSVPSPTNNSIIGNLDPIFYSKFYSFRVHWNETINSTGIEDSAPDYIGTGSDFISLSSTNPNGTHVFAIHANELGLYQVIVLLGTTNFGELRYVITFNISIMPTAPLNTTDFTFQDSLLVEDTFYLKGGGYRTFENGTIPFINSTSIWMNDSKVSSSNLLIDLSVLPFSINFTTTGYHWGTYNVTLQIVTYGYHPQNVSFLITLQGREISVFLEILQETIVWGDSVDIVATLNYANLQSIGRGASINLALLEGINVLFEVEIEYRNGTTRTLSDAVATDATQQATYTISGEQTQNAVRFVSIGVVIPASSSGLPLSSSMDSAIFPTIQPPTIQMLIDFFQTVLPFLIGLIIIIAIAVPVTRRRRTKKLMIEADQWATEQKFEDIKSIRLIIARHQSGLQFYAEKTIAELQADTDALSGMSAAMSSFLEELSESMTSQADSDEVHTKDKIEFMSREGLHMLVWHGGYSSLIIISEARLPDYFQNRLRTLGHELEAKFVNELKDFYSSDQIPSTVVKKMVRKFVPLHYFCAFVLNEGVLTLDSIKLDRKENKMLKSIKNIMFSIEGMNYFFSEQIISHLSKDYERSEAINFLDRAIQINLLIEAEQDDLLRISRR